MAFVIKDSTSRAVRLDAATLCFGLTFKRDFYFNPCCRIDVLIRVVKRARLVVAATQSLRDLCNARSAIKRR